MNMFDVITADSLFSDIVMQRTQDRRAFLLVEGESDSRVLDQYVSDENCLILIAQGRENALGAMQLASDGSVGTVGALVDSDHASPQDSRVRLSGVISTDLNDLDAEILSVDGLADRVGFTHVDGSILRNFLREHNCECVATAMTRIIAPVTALRYMSNLHEAAVPTSELPIASIYNKGTLQLDISKLVQIAKSRWVDDKKAKFEEHIDSWLSVDDSINLDRYHNGHHLMAALHVILRVECAYRAKVDNLSNSVRAALSWTELISIACIERLSAYFVNAGVWIWRHDRHATTTESLLNHS